MECSSHGFCDRHEAVRAAGFEEDTRCLSSNVRTGAYGETYKSDRRIGSKSALSVVMAGIAMKCVIEMVWTIRSQSPLPIEVKDDGDGWLYTPKLLHLSIG